MNQYKNDVDKFISSMLVNVDIARKSEWMVYSHQFDQDDDDDDNNNENRSQNKIILLSTQLEEKIRKIAKLSEMNYFVLESLLTPFQFTNGLPSSPTDFDDTQPLGSSSTMNDLGKESSSYDSALHVLTHIVRDWSSLGARIRQNLYQWITSQLICYAKQHPIQNGLPILVPGAGLGRLAFDIYKEGFHVEANEISIVMAAAAHQLLNENIRCGGDGGGGEIYPFINDLVINEVNTKLRYQKVTFPDNQTYSNAKSKNDQESSLSYTVGDFLEIYSTTSKRGRYGSIVTCFFIDTASNIYEYLLVIRNVLTSGGIWINVGPLQWHGNSQLNPSGDELRFIIESFGFELLSWAVDEEAINYRHDDMNEPTRYTKFEGYKTIRFAALLDQSQTGSTGGYVNAKEKIRMMRQGVLPMKKRFPRDLNHVSPMHESNVVIEEIN